MEFTVPHPTRSPSDARLIGLGFKDMRSEAIADAVRIRAIRGSTLDDGIDFSAIELPAFVSFVAGLSVAEPWGRWSEGERVRLEMRRPLSGRFRLHLRATAFGPNLGVEVPVSVGSQVRSFRFASNAGEAQDVFLDFDLSKPSTSIEITVPFPVSPPGDERKIGLGLIALRRLRRQPWFSGLAPQRLS